MDAGYRDSETASASSGRESKLGRRLMGWFLALSLVPLLISNGVGYIRSQRIAEGLLERSLDVASLLQVLHVQNRMDRHRVFLEAVAAGNEFLRAGLRRAEGAGAGMASVADRDAVEDYLRRQRAEGGGSFRELYLLDRDGHFLVSTGADSTASGPYPCDRQTGGVSWLRSPDPARPPALCIAVPVTGADGQRIGFLGGFVPSRDMEDFLRFPQQSDEHIRTILLDQNDRPIYFSERGTDESYASVFDTPLEEPNDRARYVNHLGVDVAGRLLQVPGLSWTQVTEVPQEEALSALRSLGRTSMYFAGFLALVLVAAAWFVSRGIVAPIGRLVSATRRLGSGDLEARVDNPGRDEVGELARSFNDMAEGLAEASARVTELHRKEIARAQHLASVGELASGLAHEIKNPVVAITHGLDLVRRRVGPNPAVDPILEEVTRELRRIGTAVRDLLSFARPASPTLAPTDVNVVVERACRLLEPSADRRGVSLHVSSVPGMPTVPADATLLQQALVNVILNAIEATPAGGEIRVFPDATELGIAIRVSDTGAGIPRDQLDQVFKPFFTTRPQGGTGLGLSITREIVERHGGTVTIDSLEAVGTTVEIMIPAGERPPTPENPSEDGGIQQ
ncbi:MAG: HAMP domain-containing protein [Gemmatimonadetes bacterium]|nr:HAMP domain-containing protein [Gemmatimonadota bacterium]